MNGFVLLIPFFLIRFCLLSMLNKGALKRAAYFPPVVGNEISAYYIYQISNIAIIIYLFFLSVSIESSWLFYAGAIVYLLGLILCAISMINYAYPSNEGLNHKGIYCLSRNPMYVSYFIFFVGCAMLARSLIFLGIVLIFIVSTHWIILSEERWCIEKLGEPYKQYMKKIRRYI